MTDAGTASAEIERRARAMDGAGKAVIATDPAGRIVFRNEAAHALFGWSADEVMGSDVVQITPSELSQHEAGQITDALRSGRRWAGRQIVRDQRGRRFLAEVTDVPVRDPAGELIGIIGISERLEYLRS